MRYRKRERERHIGKLSIRTIFVFHLGIFCLFFDDDNDDDKNNNEKIVHPHLFGFLNAKIVINCTIFTNKQWKIITIINSSSAGVRLFSFLVSNRSAAITSRFVFMQMDWMRTHARKTLLYNFRWMSAFVTVMQLQCI